MKCIRCGQEIYLPHWNSAICGNCADDLRAEQDAIEGAAIAEAEDRARVEDEQNREAYEEEARAQHFDDGGGYRYV